MICESRDSMVFKPKMSNGSGSSKFTMEAMNRKLAMNNILSLIVNTIKLKSRQILEVLGEKHTIKVKLPKYFPCSNRSSFQPSSVGIGSVDYTLDLRKKYRIHTLKMPVGVIFHYREGAPFFNRLR